MRGDHSHLALMDSKMKKTLYSEISKSRL